MQSLRSLPDVFSRLMYERCTPKICGCLRSERSQGRRTPPTPRRSLMLPLRNPTCTSPISVDYSPLVARPCCVPSPSRTSTQRQPRVNVLAEREVSVPDAKSESQSPPPSLIATMPPQMNLQCETAAGASSVLDELASWRKLKEPLERYIEFARCNYFGNADQSTDA